jgi:hypothetical protein
MTSSSICISVRVTSRATGNSASGSFVFVALSMFNEGEKEIGIDLDTVCKLLQLEEIMLEFVDRTSIALVVLDG